MAEMMYVLLEYIYLLYKAEKLPVHLHFCQWISTVGHRLTLNLLKMKHAFSGMTKFTFKSFKP